MKTIYYLIFLSAFTLITISTFAEDTINDIFGRTASGRFVGFRENQVLFIQSNKSDTLVFLIPNIDKLELSDGQVFTSNTLANMSKDWKEQDKIYSYKSLKYSQNSTIISEPVYPLIKFKE